MPTATSLRMTSSLFATCLAFALPACGPLPDETGAGVEVPSPEPAADQVEVVTRALRTGCQPGPDQVAFFVDGGFQGHCAVFDGPAVYPTWDGSLFPNDALSSVLVGGNVSVILFADGGLQGGAIRLDGSNNVAMNDATSSFKIVVRGGDCSLNPGFQPGEGEVAVWDDANFEGARCQVYRADQDLPIWEEGDFETIECRWGQPCQAPRGPAGYVPMFREGVGNDTVSSVKVGPGTTLQMFEHGNYQGLTLAAFGPGHASAYLGGANDMVSSMIVARQ